MDETEGSEGGKNTFAKTFRIDDRIDSYKPFFDHGWAREMGAISKGREKLEALIYDLALTFKGSSTVASIPQLSVDIAGRYAEGMELHRLDESLTLKIVNHLAARVEQRMVLNSSEKGELTKVMLHIAEELNDRASGKSIEFPRQELWDAFVKTEKGKESDDPKNEFRLAIWAAQRNTYSVLFFAYEDFLTSCLEIATGIEHRTGRGFGKKCEKTLGKQLTVECWDNNEIETARLVRNALVHAGGRETSDLKQKKHGVELCEGVLQIMPTDIGNLFDLLKDRSRKLAHWAATMPEFN